MKTRFLATMSHDIRTPLNGIIGMVNMGNQYADDPQMQQKIREKVMESLKYLVSLVNDVLGMNKLQSGDLKDQQLTFDLTKVLRELNQIYDERAAFSSFAFSTSLLISYICFLASLGLKVTILFSVILNFLIFPVSESLNLYSNSSTHSLVRYKSIKQLKTKIQEDIY